MSRLAILGSCVTRDAFADGGGIAALVSRTGLASLLAPAIEGLTLPNTMGQLKPGGFADRCLRADLCKTGLDLIEAAQPDTLLLDFMDERFGLWLAGGSVFTDSLEFRDAKADRLPELADGRRVDRRAAEAWALWCDGLQRLRLRLQGGPLRHTRLVLHRTALALRWAPGPAEQELRRKIDLPPARLALMQANRMLDLQHNAFQEAFPEAEIIDLPEALRVADGGHRWGPDPAHYVAGYYAEFRNRVRRLGIEQGTVLEAGGRPPQVSAG